MKKRVRIILIACILILTIAGPIISYLPIAYAQDYQSFAYITVAPDRCAAGQTVTVLFFLTNPSPTAVAGFVPDRNWNDFRVKVTSPAGKISDYGPFASDAT
jgi:hypothetical protein